MGEVEKEIGKNLILNFMSKGKINRYKKLLKDISDDDLNYLLKNSYVNAYRQNQAAWELYRGIYREFSYNLFYISAEEYYKCLQLLKYKETKQKSATLTDAELEELAQLFVYHIFKIEGSKSVATEKVRKTHFHVTHQGRPDLNPIAEGKKEKARLISVMQKYSSEELFNLKNESLYVGYRESIEEVICPIDNFHFQQPNVMMKYIENLSGEVTSKVYTLFGREEIERLINYKMLIGTKHSD